MNRGSWILASPQRAKSLQRIVKRLGGSSTYYRIDATSQQQACFKVLDAPWQEVRAK